MTEAQKDAIKRIHDIAGEHFTAFVLGVEIEDDDVSKHSRLSYEGGFNTALGLLVNIQHEMLHTRQRGDDDDD